MYGEYGMRARRDHSQARTTASIRQRGIFGSGMTLGGVASVSIILLTVICEHASPHVLAQTTRVVLDTAAQGRPVRIGQAAAT